MHSGTHRLLTTLLFFTALPVSASISPADTSRRDVAAAAAFNQLCYEYSERDPDQGIRFGLRGLGLARQLGDLSNEALAHNHIGFCLTRKSEFDSARAEFGRALSIFQKLNDRCGTSGVYYNMGLNAQMQQQDADALGAFLKAIEYEDSCPPEKRARAARLYAIGSVYANMEKWAEALPYFHEAFSLDSAAHDSTRLSQELVALGNAHAGLGRYAIAGPFFERASERALANGDSLMSAYVEYNLGNLCMQLGDGRGAILHAERSYHLLLEMERWAEAAHAVLGLGDIYTNTGRAEEGARCFERALHLADSLGIESDRIYAMLGLTNAFEALGRPKEALYWHRMFVAAKDSSQLKERNEKLDEMTTRFETEKKEKELLEAREGELLAAQEADRLRLQKVAWATGALLLAALAAMLYGRIRTKRLHVAELEQRNAEIMRQKDRAEESERAKDRFLANMSHELRTPLNAITGFTDLLLHDATDDRHRRFLTTIRNAGDNLLVMINDVLDLGRIEAGRYSLRNEPFDLHRCVHLCVDMLHARAMEQGNELLLNIHENVPQVVVGDSARLTQIILNLMGNALKFTSNGRVEVDVDLAEEGVRFVVRDNGIGIPKHRLPNIFDRFSQVHDDDQRRYGGTGLGLAIVKELVALHGGAIDVQSEENKGTVVTVTLPYTAAHSALPETPGTRAKPNGSLAGRTILIAEDNEANALVAQETLARFHPAARTVIARNGREAVEHLRADASNEIALVLMDVQMPELDGIAATTEIRALYGPASKVPIIALTASVLPSDLGRCIDAGMDACLSKPFRTENLLVTIERLIGDPGSALPHSSAGTSATAYDSLFKSQAPRDLDDLRRAVKAGDQEAIARAVHRMRPQLVHRDKARFAPLCDEALRQAHGGNIVVSTRAADLLISEVENELART